jgi:predicted HNH restriction endonuclease
MREEVKKARKAFQRQRIQPDCKCARCGMSQEQHTANGKGKLQIHHVESISKIGMAANRADNYMTLCRWCHREWHVFYEEAGISWEDFWASEVFRDSIISKFKKGDSDGE